MKPSGIITLTTDFGLQDEYVGVMKGVILSRFPQATIVDLTHNIQPHDIQDASIIIESAYRYFPPGTVHLVVVDPGVGSGRNILAVESDEHYFIAPDNGTLSTILRSDSESQVYQVANLDLFTDRVSSTFHGRDIMTPIAAALADGMDISFVGPAISVEDSVKMTQPSVETSPDGDQLIGEVIHVDHFGNIRTSISRKALVSHLQSREPSIKIGDYTIYEISNSYSEKDQGQAVALFDSRDYLEIAVNRGNAAKLLACRVGDRVTVQPRRISL